MNRGNLTVKGLSISGFSGNGVLYNDKGYVRVENLEITDNGRYGILADGDIYINSAASKSDAGSISAGTVTVSGNGGKGDGGGIRSLKKSITARNVEITGNKGPGIAAKKDIDLGKIKVNNNQGPGIQSMNGGITITGAVDDSDVNEVSGNEGPGIFAGTDMALPGAGSGKSIGGKIYIQTHITVSKNTGWGILGPSYVAVNRLDTASSGVSPHTSVISGNGDKTKKCYIVEDNGDLALLSAKAYDTGGIGSGSYIGASVMDVSDNHGPGIVAREDIHLRKINIQNNQGPGIQSMNGGITIIGAVDDSDVNEISGNHGPGIFSGVDMNVPADYGKSIFVQTHIQVRDNSGWGIAAPRKDVVVNGIEYGTRGKVSASTSYITGNGAKNNPFYLVGEDGSLGRLKKYDAGGILAGQSMAGYLLEATDNFGDGVNAAKDIYIDTGKVCNNTGVNITSNGAQTLDNVDLCK
ncbi:MAG: hypothetical protein HZA01_10270 [Nitrospinae bacterium]|nr:hypothetical protein [Nitrospinota bacterium]